jgi:23S rRNA (guanosine2251-2'-O)-methyltransferase
MQDKAEKVMEKKKIHQSHTYEKKQRREDRRDPAPRESGDDSSIHGNYENGAVVGRNAVRELLRSGRDIDKLLVQKGERNGSIVVLVAQALERKIPVVETEKSKLDALARYAPHQGVIAFAAEKEYCSVDDIIDYARSKNEEPFILIADGINDPHNLGALIRCAEAAGCHGIIIPKRRSVTLNATVSKASAGAIEHMRVAKVTNLGMAVDDLKKKGVWIYAAEADGQDIDTVDIVTPAAFVLGSEGEGVSRIVKEKSDFILSIEMKGKVNSLNVSSAAAVILFHARKFFS